MKIKPKQFDQVGATDGDALVWSTTNQQWEPGAGFTPSDLTTFLDRHHFEYPTLVIGSAAALTFTDHFNETIALAHAAVYKMSVMFFHSMNINSTDFLAELRVNGTMINLTQMRLEPKDAAGPDGGSGTGTDQKIPIYLEATYTSTAVGNVDVSLAFAASTTDDVPAVHSSELFVERFV